MATKGISQSRPRPAPETKSKTFEKYVQLGKALMAPYAIHYRGHGGSVHQAPSKWSPVMPAQILNILSAFSFFQKRDDGDVLDGFHNFWTSNLLVMFSILISFKQFAGKPMECMVPPMFPGSWVEYAENYCWAQDTYFLPFSEEREVNQISYYQWFPFYLLIQSFFFYLPAAIWRFLNGTSGIRISNLIEQAKDKSNLKPDVRTQSLQLMTGHLENALRFQHRRIHRNINYYNLLCCFNLSLKSYYLTVVYLFVKLCYLVNVLSQFFLLNKVLGTTEGGYNLYGFGALQDILAGSQWRHSGIFPRVTLCDFDARTMENVQRYTIQCVLAINLFNEKIFVFLWFWFAILAVLTTCSFVYWFFILIFPLSPRWFIEGHMELSMMKYDSDQHAKDLDKFVYTFLRHDGLFVLRMIEKHTSVIWGTDLVYALWCSYFGPQMELNTANVQTLDILKKKRELETAIVTNNNSPYDRNNDSLHSETRSDSYELQDVVAGPGACYKNDKVKMK